MRGCGRWRMRRVKENCYKCGRRLSGVARLRSKSTGQRAEADWEGSANKDAMRRAGANRRWVTALPGAVHQRSEGSCYQVNCGPRISDVSVGKNNLNLTPRGSRTGF